MRTTLTIDDDVLAVARDMADHQGRSIGEVVSDLARRSLRQPVETEARNGFPILPVKPGTGRATLAIVNELRDELP